MVQGNGDWHLDPTAAPRGWEVAPQANLRDLLATLPLPPSQPALLGRSSCSDLRDVAFWKERPLFSPLVLGVRFTNAPWQHHLSNCFPLAHGVELGKIHCEMVCPFHSFNICSESFEVLHITTSGVPPAHSSKFKSELCSLIPSPTVFCPSTLKSFSFSRLLLRVRFFSELSF